jgi:O-antigen/teichoic acid export membrane protein
VTVRQGEGRRRAEHGFRRHGTGGRHARARRQLRQGVRGLPFADNSSLTGKASRAFGWTFVSTVLSRLGTFVVGIVLARLLGPHAFGIYAVAFVALLAMQTFNELGVSLAIVRWEGEPSAIIPTVNTVSVSVSVLTYIGCYLGAPAYSSAMGAPSAAIIVRTLAVAIVIDGFANTPNALLQRSFRGGQRAIAVQVGGWLGTGATLVLAWCHYGAMSLAIGQLIGGIACVLLLLAFAPESLRFGFNPVRASALLRFGLPLAGSNLAAFAVTSVDQVIIGHNLGPVTLGFYVLALNLSSWPINLFSQPVSSVVPAVLSRLQHDRSAMQSTFLSVVGLLGAVALPACLVIGGSAKPLVSFVYGARWLPAMEPLIWLALLGAMRIFFLVAYDYLVVLGRSRFLLMVQLVWLLALIPALVVGTHAAGIYGAALSEAVVAAFVVLPCYLAGLASAGVKFRALSRRLLLPVAGASLLGLVADEAAKVAPNAVAALAIAGLASVVVVGLLAYRARGAFALLRSTAAPSPDTSVEPSSGATGDASEQVGSTPIDDLTAELAARWGVIEAPPVQRRRVQALSDVLLSSRPVHHDMTEPLPAYRDVVSYPPARRDLSLTSPLYWKTVAALNLDPSNSSNEGRSSRGGHGCRADSIRESGAVTKGFH